TLRRPAAALGNHTGESVSGVDSSGSTLQSTKDPAVDYGMYAASGQQLVVDIEGYQHEVEVHHQAALQEGGETAPSREDEAVFGFGFGLGSGLGEDLGSAAPPDACFDGGWRAPQELM
ncbi:hypothetical protein MNEG_0638, partial [Monoraphidium neglectum]